jgi:hypothetical protein
MKRVAVTWALGHAKAWQTSRVGVCVSAALERAPFEPGPKIKNRKCARKEPVEFRVKGRT